MRPRSAPVRHGPRPPARRSRASGRRTTVPEGSAARVFLVRRGGPVAPCAPPDPPSAGASPGGAVPGSTASSSADAAPAASRTDRGAPSAPSACGRQKGAADRTEPDRPRQAGTEDPPPHRPQRRAAAAGRPRRRPARQPRPQAARARRPAPHSRRGPRRRRPAKLRTGKGCDHGHPRRWLRKPGSRHRTARKGIESSTRPGRHRRAIGRTVPWPGCRRLHRRHGRTAEHFLAFAGVAAALIGCRRPAR